MKKGLSKDAKDFVADVVSILHSDKKKSVYVPRMETLLTSISDRARKEKTADVTSAVPLTEEEKQEMSKKLMSLVGHDIDLHVTVDPSVIAGLYIKIADFVIDTTYLTKLSDMTAFLKR